jgi:hypothetical protein
VIVPDTVLRLRVLRLAAASLDERVTAACYLALGALVVYLVMFDQGQALELLLASNLAQSNALHELFHDGRHLGNVPCH